MITEDRINHGRVRDCTRKSVKQCGDDNWPVAVCSAIRTKTNVTFSNRRQLILWWSMWRSFVSEGWSNYMDREHAKELWARFVSRESQTASDEALLFTLLSCDTSLRREFLEDEILDSVLACLARLDRTEETFVAEFFRRLGKPVEFAAGGLRLGEALSGPS